MVRFELALADVEFTDGRLARRLLTREVGRAVSRTFNRAGYQARSGSPRGQQEPINFGNQPLGAGSQFGEDGSGELEPGAKRGKASRWDGCICCCRDDCCDCS
jgi:hypothetical protein